MFYLLRILGWLAVPAVGATAVVLVATPYGDRELPAAVLFSAAGATGMACVAAAVTTYRTRRLTAALRSLLAGEATPLRARGMPVERELAEAFNALGLAFSDVEARSRRDRLTGVLNREALMGELVDEVARANRQRQPLSVAFIDIDRFKPINDTYGHASGDAVLRQLADLVGDNIRGTDILGRYGGEEFMLILPGTDPEDATIVTEKLRGLVMRTPLQIADGSRIQATISAGIAGDRGGELKLQQLVADADAAMYAAKSLGRNQTYVFRAVNEERRVRRAPVDAARREQALALGRWAGQQATNALAGALAPHPHHRGAPSDLIAAVAVGIADRLGLPEAEVERIRFASLLHDLGKVAIPADILDKPGALTEFEWQAVTEHPRIGQLVLEQATNLREAVPIVLHHHEHYNGKGYPHGLTGRDIPLGARIVAVADAYHAMVNDRPYQRARSHDAAIAELRRCAGTQFDPEVVETFCELFAAGVPDDGSMESEHIRHAAAAPAPMGEPIPMRPARHVGEAAG